MPKVKAMSTGTRTRIADRGSQGLTLTSRTVPGPRSQGLRREAGIAALRDLRSAIYACGLTGIFGVSGGWRTTPIAV